MKSRQGRHFGEGDLADRITTDGHRRADLESGSAPQAFVVGVGDEDQNRVSAAPGRGRVHRETWGYGAPTFGRRDRSQASPR